MRSYPPWVFRKILYVDVPAASDFKILTSAIPNFVPIYYPSVYQFCKSTKQVLLKLDAFFHHLLERHSIYVIW